VRAADGPRAARAIHTKFGLDAGIAGTAG
jgi:hypothetical protein